MRPVTERFDRTIRGSHTIVSVARVLSTYQEGTNPVGVDIPIIAGDVEADATADIRATVELSTYAEWGSLLSVYGNELFVARGVRYGGGRTEVVSLGYYRINRNSQAGMPNGVIRITGADRMSSIVDGRLTAPVHFAASTLVGTAVAELVHDIYPAATIVWDDATHALPLGRAVTFEDDRYEALRDIAASFGKVAFFNYRGEFEISTPPVESDPVWTVNAGAGGVLLEASAEQSRDRVYNGIVVTGEGADTTMPVRAVVIDDNPSSPTYWYGRFGKVPRFFSSPMITTTEQAENAGAAMLRAHLGAPYVVSLRAVPNPALEPHDPVRTVYRDGRVELHVMQSVKIPLHVRGELTGTTRERTDIVLGVV